MDLATAASDVLHDRGSYAEALAAGRRPVAVVGRDPRASGEFLESAVVAGLAGAGLDVLRLGVLPTPALAFLTADLGADLGIMLSASHNPAADNGIKMFARGGFKLPDAVEDEIESRMRDPGVSKDGPPAGGFGRVTEGAGHRERYLAHVLASVTDPCPAPGAASSGLLAPGQPAGPAGGRPACTLLAGMRVVVDCAHGAAWQFAPELLRRAGAQVIAIGVAPDGDNINVDCGSTDLRALSSAVVEHGADAGIAHDGDADRCLAVGADGTTIDGDQILAVLALSLKAQQRLAADTVVTTVMSNLGFRIAMAEAGISVVQTAVGDRYVLEAMRAGHFVLGGEQSGHVIMLDHATTGDGLLTGLHLLAAAARARAPLAEVVSVMTRYPQVLVNVAGVDKARVAASAILAGRIAAASAELGDSGRVLVRPSGTEPAVRVMVEAREEEHARRLAQSLAEAVRAAAVS